MRPMEIIQIAHNLLSIGIAIFGVIYVGRQIREARKARILEPYLKMADRIDAQRKERGFLYDHNNMDPDEHWVTAFEKTAVTFDILGVLIREDILHRPLVFNPYYDVIIKTWDCVRVHILAERDRKSHTYMEDFEYLYKEAEKYRESKGLPRPRIHQPSLLPLPKNELKSRGK